MPRSSGSMPPVMFDGIPVSQPLPGYTTQAPFGDGNMNIPAYQEPAPQSAKPSFPQMAPPDVPFGADNATRYFNYKARQEGGLLGGLRGKPAPKGRDKPKPSKPVGFD